MILTSVIYGILIAANEAYGKYSRLNYHIKIGFPCMFFHVFLKYILILYPIILFMDFLPLVSYNIHKQLLVIESNALLVSKLLVKLLFS